MNMVLYIVGGLLITYVIVSSIVILKLYKRLNSKIMDNKMLFEKIHYDQMEHEKTIDSKIQEQNVRVNNCAQLTAKCEIEIRNINRALTVTNNGFLRPTQSSML